MNEIKIFLNTRFHSYFTSSSRGFGIQPGNIIENQKKIRNVLCKDSILKISAKNYFFVGVEGRDSIAVLKGTKTEIFRQFTYNRYSLRLC